MTTAIKKTAQTTSEEKKPNLAISKTATTTQAKQEPVQMQEQTKQIPTLQQLKDRAAIVFLLQEKHTKLSEKRTSLDKFTITHEKDNATATVADMNGLEFKSSSPKTIGKLIEFWKAEFDEAISEVENELKKAFDLVA